VKILNLDNLVVDLLDLCAKQSQDELAYQVITEHIKSKDLRTHYENYYLNRKEDYHASSTLRKSQYK